MRVDDAAAQAWPGAGDRGVTLEQLRSFVAVVRYGGFHQAGARVQRSQSAVTQNVKRLEEMLGCLLLDRVQGRLLGPTAEGRRFFAQAQGVLERVEQAVALLRQPPLVGRVRLGVPDDFAVAQLHAAIARCVAANPSLRLDVVSTVSSTLRKLYRQGRLDVVIHKALAGEGEGDPDGAILSAEPLCWVAGPSAVLIHGDEVPLVVFPEGCAYRRAAVAALEPSGRRWRVAYTSASYENIGRAVRVGLGVAVLPRSAALDGLALLDAAQGFPALPMVQLVMAVRGDGGLFRQVADALAAGHALAPLG